MATRPKKDARLDFRLNRQLKELIDQAASLMGQSVSDFAVAALVEKSKPIVQENSTTELSDCDRDIFLEMLDREARPNEALKKAAKRYRARHG